MRDRAARTCCNMSAGHEPLQHREAATDRGAAVVGPGMTERPATGGEPAELRRAEHTELLALIIRGEEEATRPDGDLGEEDRLVNGHVEEDPEASMAGVVSPGTSYWSITEGPDQPLLLSLSPGPSRRKPKVQRASRPGLSRIPGRDHRRYYHEYWRSEYLMDFDPQRHGMICMVCGSSLATLKLSTIKRHIRQKHPDSLLWSAADKDVIRSGWENHLGVGGCPRLFISADELSLSAQEQSLDDSLHAAELQDPVTPQEEPRHPLSLSTLSKVDEVPQPPEVKEEEREVPGPSPQTLERYLNDSLHAWFRQEFLMEYEAEAGRLLCMVCGGQLPSLHLDHIKSHVLDTHPNSLVYSSEEKHCILQAWAHTHEELNSSIRLESNTKEVKVETFALDVDPVHIHADNFRGCDSTIPQDTCLIGEADGAGVPHQGPQLPRRTKKKRLRGGNPWRLRLDYLVAYGPQGSGTFCMVCSQVLHHTKVSSIRQHIQACHPETTTLSQQEREAMAAAWTKDDSSEGSEIQDEISLPSVLKLTGDRSEDVSPDAGMSDKTIKTEDGMCVGRVKAKDSSYSANPSRHYPGKDQRRNYQARWRLEYLMDYDCRRHGLICMVCGATLATLKVSTIKRHIQQVHPLSLKYDSEEKQQVLMRYNKVALGFIHSDDCFFSRDHATEPASLASSPPICGT